MADLSKIQTKLGSEQILNNSNINANTNQDKPTKDQNLSPKEQEDIKDSQSSRWLRVIYAFIAIGFALASVIYWMRFVHFYYIPEKHSDVFFCNFNNGLHNQYLSRFSCCN